MNERIGYRRQQFACCFNLIGSRSLKGSLNRSLDSSFGLDVEVPTLVTEAQQPPTPVTRVGSSANQPLTIETFDDSGERARMDVK
jgi:hypothetical protein